MTEGTLITRPLPGAGISHKHSGLGNNSPDASASGNLIIQDSYHESVQVLAGGKPLDFLLQEDHFIRYTIKGKYHMIMITGVGIDPSGGIQKRESACG